MGGSKSKKGTTKSPQSPQSLKRKRKAKAAAETKSVDINNEDYDIRSPERPQPLTQIERTTRSPQSLQSLQSPERKRKGKAAAETKSVDVDDEDYNIRSPKCTRLSTQIEEATKSPEERRRAKAAAPETRSVDVNNEDYNIRSPERTQLLTQIKGILNNTPVSPAFWACCHLADMNCLQELAILSRKMIVYLQKPLSSLPSQWNQGFRDSQSPGSETASQRPEGQKKRKLNSDARLPVPRSAKEADNCKKRDGYKCILTGLADPQAAYIFPHCLLQPRPEPDPNKASTRIPDFWEHLSLFWDEDRVNTIFQDPQNPDIGVERCFNLISLSSHAYNMWNKGLFALKPLELSRDRKTLTVQFFWQVRGNYKSTSRVDLLTEASPSKDLEFVTKESGRYFLNRDEDDSTPRIRSGDRFIFTTEDPKNLPLPSLELLEMQWVLQRLVGMCGAAEWPSLDEIDDDTVDDDDGCPVPDYQPVGRHQCALDG